MSLELVSFITQNLVTEPDKLAVVTTQNNSRNLRIEIRCAPDDTGRIIGRGGRIINSIRTLARAASDGRQRVEVQLID
ncbi:MAG: KH domain-containing protein [Trueperaceae bacterium]|nr:MAG: KH domain-containing protein [Trueperaceae bacterium]